MTDSRIWVIGGANIDICGMSEDRLRDFDSNIGSINLRFGGVGRNIAQAAALLGAKVSLVTCFSHDHYGEFLKRDCEEMGIDIRSSITSDKYPSSMYLALINDHGDMHIAMCDMRILEEMDFEMIDNMLLKISPNDILVMDTNIKEEYLEYILEKANCRIAVDPISVSKIHKLGNEFHRISIFKPNAFEAKALTGLDIVDDSSAKDAINWFRSRGIEEIIITMADKGVLLGYEEKAYWLTHRAVELENTNGGGDTFLGAYLAERIMGREPLEAARLAMSAAVLVIESNDVEHNQISKERVLKEIEFLHIKEKEL